MADIMKMHILEVLAILEAGFNIMVESYIIDYLGKTFVMPFQIK